MGEKLGKMEVEKRQAVENEDYDKAKVKKLQMDEYRLQIYKDLNVHDLLESSGVGACFTKISTSTTCRCMLYKDLNVRNL